jgi:hypothetical protein
MNDKGKPRTPAGQKRSMAIQEKFGDLWPLHNIWFGAVLTECRRYFEGDLDQALIVAVIGTRTLFPARLEGISYDDFLRGLRNDAPMLPINVQSVAESTGIPRESVRRKVAHLIDRGWIEKQDDGYLFITERAITELSPITQITLAYFEEMKRKLVQ